MISTTKLRKLLVINLIVEGTVQESTSSIGELIFEVTEHRIGWNFEVAESLIRHYDGYVDGICLSGIQKEVRAGKSQYVHPGYLRLVRQATKSSIYVSDDIAEVFTEWTLKRVLKDNPQFFYHRKVLFQCAILSSSLQSIAEASGKIYAADPLVILGIPVILCGVPQIEFFLNRIRSLFKVLTFNKVRPLKHVRSNSQGKVLAKAMRSCDIFVTYGRMLSALKSFEALSGKTVIVDHVTASTRSQLEKATVARIIEVIPQHPAFPSDNFKHFSVMAAIVDQMRVAEDNPAPFAEYLLNWFERTGVSPNRVSTQSMEKRKCAFLIHPLSQKQIWQAPGMRVVGKSPEMIRKIAEKLASRAPGFHAGNVTGIKSPFNGQEVECELYAIPATPKELLALDNDFVYRRMAQCVEMARSRGASMAGLGAFLKVIGDAGVTVARRSPIPVTNGNSYSVSTTLWAAREMVEKMGMIQPEREGKRFKARAMIIGATGSIGRVSSLLVSTVFTDLVLVANRPDKLLELKEEIRLFSPGVRVKLTTQANTDVGDTDLIITATSNISGKVLDIERVKPGAVICDCSRPLDVDAEQAAKRPDVLVIESGEVLLPGNPHVSMDIGLPQPSVYACLAETVLLTLEGQFESFSLSKELSMEKVKEIYRLGLKHGASLSAIQGPLGVVTDDVIQKCRGAAIERLKSWKPSHSLRPGLTVNANQAKPPIFSKNQQES